jgi:predicted nucleic-acid-binding protein
VFEAAPNVASRNAREVTIDEFVQLIGNLTQAGKGRTAAKLRSYLRAAYSLAISSKTDPDAPFILRSFRIEANPVPSVGARALSRYNRARKRVLDAEVEILSAFSELLSAVDMSFEDEPSIEEALFVWKDSAAQFADCLIGARYRALGRTATATFDGDALKLPAFIAV